PGSFHIRNSNGISLAAQTRLSGGEPVTLGNALDRADDLSAKIELGLKEDILVLSGGVSMGKYDLVECVLKSMGAEFFFDAVAIRPGKPAVFGRCRDTFVFGLPGNPVSTMVTFQLFVTPAIDVLGGAHPRQLPLLEANLVKTLHEKPGLTHFLPASFEWTGISPEVCPLDWQGSGDIATLTRANCFIVVPADRHNIPAGAKVSVLPPVDVYNQPACAGGRAPRLRRRPLQRMQWRNSLITTRAATSVWWTFPRSPSPRALPLRMPSCACLPRCCAPCAALKIPRAIRWKSRASRASPPPSAPRSGYLFVIPFRSRTLM